MRIIPARSSNGHAHSKSSDTHGVSRSRSTTSSSTPGGGLNGYSSIALLTWFTVRARGSGPKYVFHPKPLTWIASTVVPAGAVKTHEPVRFVPMAPVRSTPNPPLDEQSSNGPRTLAPVASVPALLALQPSSGAGLPSTPQPWTVYSLAPAAPGHRRSVATPSAT